MRKHGSATVRCPSSCLYNSSACNRRGNCRGFGPALQTLSRNHHTSPHINPPSCLSAQTFYPSQQPSHSLLQSLRGQRSSHISGYCTTQQQNPSNLPPGSPAAEGLIHIPHPGQPPQHTANMGSINACLLAFFVAATAAVQLAAADWGGWGEGRGAATQAVAQHASAPKPTH